MMVRHPLQAFPTPSSGANAPTSSAQRIARVLYHVVMVGTHLPRAERSVILDQALAWCDERNLVEYQEKVVDHEIHYNSNCDYHMWASGKCLFKDPQVAMLFKLTWGGES